MNVRKEFRNKDELYTYLLNEVKYFSPSFLSAEYGINQKIAVEICDELSQKYEFIKKCYMYDCPKCGASTGFGGYYPIEDESYLTCDSCGYEDVSSDFILVTYYENEGLKKKSDLDTKVTSIQNDLDIRGLPVEETKILTTSENIIWHISDVHFGVKALWGTRNHSQIRVSAFLRLLGKRMKANLKEDIVVISGDLTTDGEEVNFKEFEKFYNHLLALGIKEENILIVPGNHDAWLGAWRVRMALNIPWNKFFRPAKVKRWPKFLAPFNTTKILNLDRNINGCTVNFNLADTTILREISIGHFPELDACKLSHADLKILVLHHHVINLERKWSGVKEAVEESLMKVRNDNFLKEWIKKSKINFVMHGHKHFQYFSHESYNDSIIVAAPSLSEEGEHPNKENIGFNCIIPRKKNFDILLANEVEGKFVVDEFFSLKAYK